jgi:hypothetical protein
LWIIESRPNPSIAALTLYLPVANIPVGTAPNITDMLPGFEAPTNWADNYGTRMRGYITAPSTGSYTFWIASGITIPPKSPQPSLSHKASSIMWRRCRKKAAEETTSR